MKQLEIGNADVVKLRGRAIKQGLLSALSAFVILKHPCVPCAGLTRVAIRHDSENKGRSWGGGGADTRREGLRENSV